MPWNQGMEFVMIRLRCTVMISAKNIVKIQGHAMSRYLPRKFNAMVEW